MSISGSVFSPYNDSETFVWSHGHLITAPFERIPGCVHAFRHTHTLSLSPSYAHACTHTHTRTRTRTHTYLQIKSWNQTRYFKTNPHSYSPPSLTQTYAGAHVLFKADSLSHSLNTYDPPSPHLIPHPLPSSPIHTQTHTSNDNQNYHPHGITLKQLECCHRQHQLLSVSS